MKKYLLILMTFCVVILAACNKDDDKKEKNDSIEVEKNLTNVEITLPSEFVEGQNFEDIQEEAKEAGVKEVIQNDDGSVTYKMTKQAHKKLMKELKESLIDTLEDLKTDSEYPSIKDVKYNKTFDEFTLVVDKKGFENGFESLATFALGISGMYYQLFNGVEADQYNVKINLEDEATGKVYNTINYPEALEALEKDGEEQ